MSISFACSCTPILATLLISPKRFAQKRIFTTTGALAIAITLHFSPTDLRRVRFAISPAFEVLSAIRVLTGPQQPGEHQRWAASARAHAIDLRPITLLQPRRGYTPDFLAPPPFDTAADFESELVRIAATDPVRVRTEIARSLADTPGATDSALGRTLLADPGKALHLLTDLIRQAWTHLVKPVWPRVRALLDTEIALQSRRLAEGGLDRLFTDLYPSLTWHDNTLTRARGDNEYRDLAGEGLVLVPSAFKWDQAIVVLDPPWQPSIVYPARGIGALWHATSQPDAALANLIGRTRAMLLAGLSQPATTSWLSHRYALAPATVSAHLSVLKAAGLITGSRSGHEIHYQQTPKAATLLEGLRGCRIVDPDQLKAVLGGVGEVLADLLCVGEPPLSIAPSRLDDDLAVAVVESPSEDRRVLDRGIVADDPEPLRCKSSDCTSDLEHPFGTTEWGYACRAVSDTHLAWLPSCGV